MRDNNRDIRHEDASTVGVDSWVFEPFCAGLSPDAGVVFVAGSSAAVLSPGVLGAGVDEGWLSSSANNSSKAEVRLLFPDFFMTYSLRPDFKLGCLSMMSRSCSLGSCSNAPKLAGAISLAHRMNPSHSGGTVQTFLIINRVNSVLETNPTNVRYVETAWITCILTFSQDIPQNE